MNSPSQINLLRTRTTLCAARALKTPFSEVWQKQVPSSFSRLVVFILSPAVINAQKKSKRVEEYSMHYMLMLLLFIAYDTT